jgi:hypothetical protein
MKHIFAIFLFLCTAALTSCDLYSGLVGDDDPGSIYFNSTRVTNDTASSAFPSLVWTGSEYGVCWHDYRDGTFEIYFARINASGVKQGSDVRLTITGVDCYYPSLVWTGSEYGVCWHDIRNGYNQIYFARINASGVKQGSDVQISNFSSYAMFPSLVWTGSEYGVCWRDDRNVNYDIYFARISASGVKQGNDVRITNAAGNSGSPSLVWTGSEYGVCWEDDRNSNNEIYFARLNASGIKQGSDVRVTNDAGESWYSSLVWTGSEYGVCWNYDRDSGLEIYFARINASGVKQGSDIRITNAGGLSWSPSLVWTGSEFGVSWQDDRDSNDEIYFTRINASGVKQGSDVRITNAAGHSDSSSLVWTGSEYGVCWCDDRDGNPPDIYFAQSDH